MDAFLAALVRLSLLGSLLAGLVLLLKPLFRRFVSRTVYYYLWVLVLVRLCLPVGVTLPVMLPEAENPFYRMWASSPAMPPDVPDVPEVPDLPEPPDLFGGDSTRFDSEDSTLFDPPTLPDALEVPEVPAPPAWWGEVLRMLATTELWMGVWAVGVLVCAGRYGVGYWRFARSIRTTVREPAPEALAVLRELDPKGKVGLVESAAVNTPLLTGLVRPVILLPPGTRDEARLRDILAHELTHAQRGDLWYKWCAAAVGCVHWFNPVLTVIRREISRACELSCDERVVQGLPPERRRHYGETLLALAAEAPAGLPAVTLCEEKRQLKERLVSLVKVRKHGPGTVALSVLLALAVGSCALVGDTEHPPEVDPEGEAHTLVDAWIPYETGGMVLPLPEDVYDQLLIFPGDVDEDGNWVTLASVYEKQSYEESMADSGLGAGFLFSITRSDQAQFEEFLMGDGSGQTCFARDEEYYYLWNVATDVQFYRSGVTDYSQADFTPWEDLNKRLSNVAAEFAYENGLENYSSDEFFSREFTYEGEHHFARFVLDSYGIDLTLTLSQPVRQGEGGIWCVERYTDHTNGERYCSFAIESPLPQDQGVSAAEHYQTCQDAADQGDAPELLDPLEAAKVWLKCQYPNILDETLDSCTTLLEG